MSAGNGYGREGEEAEAGGMGEGKGGNEGPGKKF